MTYDSILAALSDPSRRQIVERLRRGPSRLGALAEGMPISRPAVSQHVRMLCDAGVVIATGDGARKDYALNAAAIGALRAWLDMLWTDALTAFAKAAEKEDLRS
jgi:DNA-binding transcriptional ArsR family regulator